MAEQPVARSPIAPSPPTTMVAGWEVSARRSDADLRLADVSALAKVHVRSDPDGPVAAALGVRNGRAQRDEHGTLVVGSGPDEWSLFAGAGSAATVAGRVLALPELGFTSVVDVTHGRAFVRLTGARAADALAKVCAVNLADRVTPNGAAFRSSLAGVTSDVVRDDVDGERSYLLSCERSSGQYLFDSLLDAGAELGIDTDGFAAADGFPAYDAAPSQSQSDATAPSEE